MRRKYSLITLPPFLMATLALVSLCVFAAIWVREEFRNLDRESATRRGAYIAEQKQLLTTLVGEATSFIEFNRAQVESRVRRLIRDRTDEAHAVATHLLDTFGATRTHAQLESMVREALRPIRFNDGRGYYFAFNLKGVEQLFADRPELEGKNMLGMQGAQGEYVVRDMIAIARRHGEGYYRYYWTKPGQPRDKQFEKLAYVKLIKPLGWVVGTGEYMADMESDVKAEVLRRIGKMRLPNDEYVFAGQYDGVTLAGPHTGDNMIGVTDVNGVKIVQELIKTAKAGGGFVQYVIPKFGKGRSAAKLSYVAPVPDWHWYVGVGTFIDNIEATIAKREVQFHQRLYGKLAFAFVMMLVGALAAFFTARWISAKVRTAFDVFMTFFEHNRSDVEPIDVDKLAFREFAAIADAANQMVAAQTHDLRVAKEEADLANRAKSRFLAKMSHELRTPLNAIIGFSDAVLQEVHGAVGNPKHQEYLTLINQSGHHLLALINDILDLSKIEAGKMKLHEKTVPVDDLVDEVASLALPLVEPNGNRLEVDASDDLGAMRVDAVRVRQVLLNLIGNAGKFTDDGVVTFRVRRLEAHGTATIVFTIEDTGIGIDAARLPNLFEEFVQVGDALVSSHRGGAGLGLAITRALVQTMGGTVAVDSTKGEGTTFAVSLPVDGTTFVAPLTVGETRPS